MSTTTDFKKTILAGTRVYCALWHCGTVFAVHGEQQQESNPTVLHEMASGGAQRFDVVFDNGTIARDIAEWIVRGVPWTVLDGIAAADDIAAALTKAACLAASKTASKTQALQIYNAEIERLSNAAEFSHLTQGADKYSGKLAARNIRAELKLTFSETKFSVRKTDSGGVQISWVDGPTSAQVEEVTSLYRAGNFNVVEDTYEYRRSPWIAVFGAAHHIHMSRGQSNELVCRAIDALFVEYPDNFSGIDKPTAERFKNGGLLHVLVPGFEENLQRLIHQRAAVTTL